MPRAVLRDVHGLCRVWGFHILPLGLLVCCGTWVWLYWSASIIRCPLLHFPAPPPSLSLSISISFARSLVYLNFDFRCCAGADQELFGAFLAMRDVPAGLQIREALAQAHGAVAGVGGGPEGFLPLMKTLLPSMESAMLRSVMACSS